MQQCDILSLGTIENIYIIVYIKGAILYVFHTMPALHL